MISSNAFHKEANINVLIAEECPVFLYGLRDIISRTVDMNVVAASSNGKEVVSLAEKSMPDVALIDVTMPELDGITIARQIKARCPHTAILMLSTYDEGFYVAESFRAGALGYLCKNAPIDEIIDCIRRANKGMNLCDSRVAGKLLRRILEGPDNAVNSTKGPTYREKEVLRLVAKGMGNTDIAARLYVSDHTVHSHMTAIFRKLGVKSRHQAVIAAVRVGWLNFEDLAEQDVPKRLTHPAPDG